MFRQVFASKGFQPGSFGYDALTAVASLAIVMSAAAFVLLLVFEVGDRRVLSVVALLWP